MPSRYGPQYGPDITFLGVGRCDWADRSTYADADVVILGAPFDGGTSHRPGTRFGPQYIRQTCYLAHDGSRPSLALRVDGLGADLRVLDAGDVEMFSGDAERSVRDLQTAVPAVAGTGAIPLVLGGDHTIAWPDAAGVAQHVGRGRVSMIHFDAHADTGDVEFGSLVGHGQPMRRLIESGAVRGDRFLQLGLRGYWPGPETLAWMAAQGMRAARCCAARSVLPAPCCRSPPRTPVQGRGRGEVGWRGGSSGCEVGPRPLRGADDRQERRPRCIDASVTPLSAITSSPPRAPAPRRRTPLIPMPVTCVGRPAADGSRTRQHPSSDDR